MAAIDIAQLARFVTLAQSGSFRRAAEKLGITQPTLSWSIRQLEEALGSKLVERGPRGAGLTELGRTLLPRARLIVNESDRAVADFLEIRRVREIAVAVGVAPIFINDIFPRASAAALERLPELLLRVTEGYSPSLMAALRAGELDMVLAGPPADSDLSGITFQRLYHPRFSLVAHRSHPIFKSGKLTDASVLDHPSVMFDTASPILDSALPQLASTGRPKVRAYTTSTQYIKSMILRGGMVGYLPADYIRRELENGVVREIPNKVLSVATTAGLLTRSGSPMTRGMRVLTAEIRKACLANRD